MPDRWHFIIRSEHAKRADLAAERRIYGDGDGYFISMIALALMDANDFDWKDAGLHPEGEGFQRQARLMRAASYVIEWIEDRKCNTHDQYRAAVEELSSPAHREALRKRLID